MGRLTRALNRLLEPARLLVLSHDRLAALLAELDRLRAALAHERHKVSRLKASVPAAEAARTPYTEKLQARVAAMEAERKRLSRDNRLALGKLRWHWATYAASAQQWEALQGRLDPVAARRRVLRDRLVELMAEPEFPADDRGVTVVVTSCNRHDLLERTLESFFAVNTCPIERVIVVEDGDAPFPLALRARFAEQPIDWIHTGERVGQIRAIDAAYDRVGTPYVFHMEDDWEFLRPGFIEASLPILEAEPMCLQVWLRGLSGPYIHEFDGGDRVTSGVRWRRAAKSASSVWHGFSFNPALKRLRDYRLLGTYADHVEAQLGEGGRAEGQLSELYASIGYFAASWWIGEGDPAVEHLGYGRRVS